MEWLVPVHPRVDVPGRPAAHSCVGAWRHRAAIRIASESRPHPARVRTMGSALGSLETMQGDFAELLRPKYATSRSQVLTRPSPVPASPGVYAWYFDAPPPGVPTAEAHQTEFGHLLYVGISPNEPPRNGKPPSKGNLRTRIRFHYRGNASSSTLRLTLGSRAW